MNATIELVLSPHFSYPSFQKGIFLEDMTARIELLSVKDFSEAYNGAIKPRTVYAAIKRNEIKNFRPNGGKGAIKIPLSEVEAYEQRMTGTVSDETKEVVKNLRDNLSKLEARFGPSNV